MGQTILVVDDDAAIRKVAKRVLELHGYGVISVGTADEAHQVLNEGHRPVDLLLTDVRMPGMDGRELASSLRSTHPGLRVLFTSGMPAESFAGGARGSLDADAPFIEKPYAVTDLVDRVREALDAPPSARTGPDVP